MPVEGYLINRGIGGYNESTPGEQALEGALLGV